MASTKITGLTHWNVRALQEITPTIERAGFAITTTSTTATFDGLDNARQVLAALQTIMAGLPSKGHPRASLHAVARKLRKLADAEVAESFVTGEEGPAARTAPVVPGLTAEARGEAIAQVAAELATNANLELLAGGSGLGSTYLVWFASILIPRADQEALISRRIESASFIEVEDWAHENTPEGYELSEITKAYGDDRSLNTLGGPVDVNLRERPTPTRWNVNDYRGRPREHPLPGRGPGAL